MSEPSKTYKGFQTETLDYEISTGYRHFDCLADDFIHHTDGSYCHLLCMGLGSDSVIYSAFMQELEVAICRSVSICCVRFSSLPVELLQCWLQSLPKQGTARLWA